MDLLGYLSRLFDYDLWANREAIASIGAAQAPLPRSLRWMAHIQAAEELWEARLRRSSKKVVVWPERTLEECVSRQDELAKAWPDYLANLTTAELSRPIDYVNSKGEAWNSTVGDILTHVVIHSAYHRGQIAADLRAANQAPAYTDFIHCVRQGLLK